ncbi:MAG TPA: LacI family DNA-binding transcriptional regulator [Opitutales bacterium]|nr:LacI family DNA-binding transcriptional regulator [Opitutales bacterium]
MITIKDISAKTGFSPSTVSYALRDNPRIPVETRAKIKEAAAELGYQRDAHLGQLMAHLKNRKQHAAAVPVVWLNSTTNPNHWHETPWAKEFYESAAARAREQGFALSEIWVHDQKIPHPRLDEVLKARGTQGLILSTPLKGQDWTQWVDWNACATVVLDDPFALPQFDRVYANYCANMRTAVEQALARGYTRPKVWLSEYEDYWTGHGYTYECLRQNRVHPELGEMLTPFTREITAESVRAWMDEYRPDLVIAPTATVGMRLVELGYRIPEDLGYIAMYVLNSDSKWSGISQLHGQQSSIAVDRLAALLQQNTIGRQTHPLHIQIRGEWHEGTTLRAPVYAPSRFDR